MRNFGDFDGTLHSFLPLSLYNLFWEATRLATRDLLSALNFDVKKSQSCQTESCIYIL